MCEIDTYFLNRQLIKACRWGDHDGKMDHLSEQTKKGTHIFAKETQNEMKSSSQARF